MAAADIYICVTVSRDVHAPLQLAVCHRQLDGVSKQGAEGGTWTSEGRGCSKLHKEELHNLYCSLLVSDIKAGVISKALGSHGGHLEILPISNFTRKN
jgi:hypothetical protein